MKMKLLAAAASGGRPICSRTSIAKTSRTLCIPLLQLVVWKVDAAKREMSPLLSCPTPLERGAEGTLSVRTRSMQVSDFPLKSIRDMFLAVVALPEPHLRSSSPHGELRERSITMHPTTTQLPFHQGSLNTSIQSVDRNDLEEWEEHRYLIE